MVNGTTFNSVVGDLLIVTFYVKKDAGFPTITPPVNWVQLSGTDATHDTGSAAEDVRPYVFYLLSTPGGGAGFSFDYSDGSHDAGIMIQQFRASNAVFYTVGTPGVTSSYGTDASGDITRDLGSVNFSDHVADGVVAATHFAIGTSGTEDWTDDSWTVMTEQVNSIVFNAGATNVYGLGGAHYIRAGGDVVVDVGDSTWARPGTTASESLAMVVTGFGSGAAVNSSPDISYPYDRRRANVKELPFILDTGLLRNL